MKGLDTLAALEREVARFGALIDTLNDERWAAPTRCPPLTVFELTVHVLRGAIRIKELVGGPPILDEPEKDGATYFRFDPAVVGPTVVERARTEAASRSGAALAKEWEFAWSAAFTEATLVLEHDDPVVASPLGTLRLSEYLRTRAVEVCVHHMDVRDAFGLDPDPDPDALGVTAGVLRDLLGADLRQFGVDDVRFTLTGTGRVALSEHERAFLGPLAERFPLLS